ncbi:MAG: hypothetical protein A3J76_03480 [Candidatus Moranbacteria bacterium RBG_13_45_13]|nr:MAG: hypothetical protein A3J76_03480 [Candidatus Moranbacteria bacterium RBG_13_45_13]
MQSYGKKARSSRATAQLSGILPNMVSCWGNGGSISNPDGNGGENVCSIGSGYGQWPGLTGALANYSYESTYLFTNDSNWFFIVRSDGSHDNVTICCNSTMNSCENIGDASAACDQSTTW